MNRVHLFGNLGADPELKHTQGGQALCKFRIATKERVKRNAEWVEETEWHSITLWGKRAETIAKHLRKGSSVCVMGRLRTSQYEKKGQKHYSTEIVAEIVEFGAKKGGARSQGDDDGPPADDDDIPY